MVASALIGAGANILGGLFGSSGEKKAAKLADKRIREGVDYATNRSDLATIYAPQGGQAFNQMGAMLGLGGDQGAANQGFQNFLGSTGYRTRLQGGTDAINTNMASRGLMNSSANLKGMARYGQGLASSEYGNYMNYLSGIANQGYGAASQITGANTQGASQSAGALRSGYANAGNTMGSALISGADQIASIWR